MRVPKGRDDACLVPLVSSGQNAYDKNVLLGNMSHESADPPDTFPLESFYQMPDSLQKGVGRTDKAHFRSVQIS